MLSRPDAASSSPGGREGSRAALERRRVRPASTRTASCAAWQKPSPSLSLRPAPPGGLEVGRSLCGEAAARVGRHPEPAFALRPTLRLLYLSAVSGTSSPTCPLSSLRATRFRRRRGGGRGRRVCRAPARAGLGLPRRRGPARTSPSRVPGAQHSRRGLPAGSAGGSRRSVRVIARTACLAAV